ncbi:hypothetical protein CRUP_029637 [Coryphaenoides rupestris]|nr:hypothetical protein CRUP_029637 [Coryphaenoides rupestris]
MEEVIKLPVTDKKPQAKKREHKPKYNAEAELIKRQRHVKDLTVLGEEDASVKLLEDLVFGAEDELEERLIEDKQCASLLDDDDGDAGDLDEAGEESQVPPANKAAWVDEDDEKEEEVDMSHRFRRYLVKKCLHANAARSCNDELTTVQFHPSAQVVMTAGLDMSISLFQVDGSTNPKIQSIHLDRFPIHKAQFTRDGEWVVATGVKNKMFYMYDMMEGRVVPIFSVRGLKQSSMREFSVSPEGDSLLLPKEVVQSLKINGSVSGVAFSPDGSNVFAQSEEGEVYVWDMRSSRCLNKFADDGCVKGTSIAASRNGQYLACGSQSGVVNVYSQQECLTSANPGPLKTLMNLLNPVTSLAFNPASEILAMASRNEDEAVRMVHLPSLTVFSNFPIPMRRKFLYRANCIDFSPHSGFFSLANNKGVAQLMRMREFSVSPEGDSLLLSGNDGYLHVLKLKTKEVVQSLKINGSVSGVAFSPDGSNVFAQSEEGEVYVWDMRSSRCLNKFADDGCVKGTSIAASRNGQYLACGSQSGVVNVYSQQECLTSANPGPLKTLMNLLNPVTSLAFNPASEILAMASRNEDEAVRMVHLPSLTVFSNFPIPMRRKFLYRANCIDFSPHSGFFSLANNKGVAQLMRLLYYKDF